MIRFRDLTQHCKRERLVTMITLTNTYQDVMSNEITAKYVKQFMPAFIFDLISPEQTGKTLEELKEEVKLPWGTGFPVEDIMTAANFGLALTKEHNYEFVPLWKEVTGQNIGSEEGVYLIAPAEKNCEKGAKKPAVIICPGGAYSAVSIPNEGLAYAAYMEKAGYVPFILRYRVAPDRYPLPQQDLALAIKYVRKNAEKYGLDSDDLLLMGSSAGGHLCAILAAFHDEYDSGLMKTLEQRSTAAAEEYRNVPVMPQKLSLSYAAITFADCPDDDICYNNLIGGRLDMKEKVSVERHVGKNYPKTFLWFCEDDDTVPPVHGDLLYQALLEKGVPCKRCAYPTGNHGCGLAWDTSAAGWIDTMLEFMKD